MEGTLIHNVILGAFDESIAACAEELVSAGDDLKTWAADHLDADQSVTGIFNDLLSELGG